MDISTLTVASTATAVAERQVTATRLVEDFYDKISAEDGDIHAYLTLSKERALTQANRIDDLAGRGEPLPPLAGVPVAIKDVMVTRGVRSTAGSKILGNFIPPYDCTAVARLEAAGAIILGKTNCDEFAMGSAAVVAAGTAVASLGSDTGGSIRQPASFCGVVGLMPTYGRVSRYGLIAFASSLDHIGPFTKTVNDAAIVLGVIAGRDPMDSTSADVPVPDYQAEIGKPVRGLKLGVPSEYFGEGLDSEVRESVEAAIQRLALAGAEIVPISLPHTAYAIPAYYLIATAEASSNLARYDGVRYGYRSPNARSLAEMYRKTRDEGFGAEVKRRIMLGTYALSSGYYDAYYLKAQKVRTLIARDFSNAFAKVDAIVTPTAPTAAFKLGEKADDPLSMYLADIYTVTADLAGIPAVNVPCGQTKSALPIGLQILGKHFDEGTILRAAHVVEHEIYASRA
jgi:aspartyl-tRNA(Asn)/glutamyl-tRNA(Gln) amidotransferase subunit A